MKESSWENSTEDSSEFFDSEALLNDSDATDQVAPQPTKVNRVTQLLKICRDRLHATEEQIHKILDNKES